MYIHIYTYIYIYNLGATLTTAISTNIAGVIEASLKSELANTMRVIDASVNKKLDDMSMQVNGLKSRVSECEANQSSMASDIARITTNLGLMENVTYETLQVDDDFDRAPDPTTLSIGAADLVAKDTLFESLMPWLDRLGLSDKPFKLQGPPAGRDFTLKFTGNLQSAAQRAKKANLLLRSKETGEWDKLYTKNQENETTQIYIGPDKPPKLKREIQLTKRLRKAFEAVHSDITSYYNPRIRHVCIDKTRIAKVVAVTFESFEVQWIDEHIDLFKLDKAKILQNFDNHSGTAHNYTYSV